VALVKLMAGTVVDIPTRDEMGGYVDHALAGAAAAQAERDRVREQVRGIKPMRLPLVSGKAAGGVLSIGQQAQAGPRPGYAWSVTRLVVSGLTTGTTPDVVNVYVNDSGGNQQPLWNLNGNNFGYTFGPLQVTVRPGEIILLANVGSFAATGQIVLSGELVEIPAEMLAKLAFA
jgi:hypothetical protein